MTDPYQTAIQTLIEMKQLHADKFEASPGHPEITKDRTDDQSEAETAAAVQHNPQRQPSV